MMKQISSLKAWACVRHIQTKAKKKCSNDCFSGDETLEAAVEEAPTPRTKKLQISTPENLRIQVCSDSHLEFYGSYERVPTDINVPEPSPSQS